MGIRANIKKIKRSNVASQNIEASLIMYLYEKRHSPITSRFTGMGLSECDVLSISTSDYIYEYEIKISRGDFKKDFVKEKHSFYITEKYTNDKGEYNRPNYFTYVTPTDLIKIEEVPEYAGLIYWDGINFTVIKEAPRAHKIKASTDLIRKIAHQLSNKLIFNKII